MIRHIVLFRLKPSTTAEQVEEIRAALSSLSCPGRTSYSLAPDLGLRADNMDLAIVADFEDVDAYVAYDRDPAHDRIRREMIAPIVEQIVRCQYQL